MIDCNKGKIELRSQWQSPNAAEWRRQARTIVAQFSKRTATPKRSFTSVAKSQARNLSGALGDALNQVEGAYSLVVLTPEELYAVRDPRGFFRPLKSRQTRHVASEAWIVASESCASIFSTRNSFAKSNPAKWFVISKSGIEVHSFRRRPSHTSTAFSNTSYSRAPTAKFSPQRQGQPRNAGRLLAKEYPVDARSHRACS